MRKKGLVLGGLIVLFMLAVITIPACAQQNITVSMGDVSLYQGQQKNVSIMITKDTAQSVSSARINLTFNSSVVHVLSAGNRDFTTFNANINNITGLVRIIGWNTTSLSTNITLAEVTLKAIGDPGEFTGLNIEIDELRDGFPLYPREVSNGSASILTPRVSISATPTTRTVDVNTDANYTITVKNTGGSEDNISLSLTSTAENAVLTDSSVQLGAGNSADVMLRVSNSTGGTHSTTVKATSQYDNTQNASVTVTTKVTAAPVYGVSITPNVTSKSVEKNENATYMLTITNTGNQPDTYTLSKSSEPGMTAYLNTTSVLIPAGGSANVILKVHGTTPREDYVTQVTASSANALASVQVKTSVIKALGLSVNPASRAVYTNVNATYIITLENTGNKQHIYNIIESEPVGTLNVTIVTLDVGESAPIELKVSSGTTGSYVVTVTANTTTARGVQDQASIITTTTVSDAPVYGVALSVDKNSQSVNKNDNASFILTIQNTGNQQDAFNLTVVNTRADSAILSGDATQALAAGASITRTLNVSDSASGTYDVDVIAVSQKYPAKQDSITASTRVNGYGVLITTDTQSQTRKVGDVATYTLTIKNMGNTNDSFCLSVVKNSDTASLSKSSITGLAPGATDTVTLTVIDDTADTYYANVTATSEGDGSKADYVNVSTTFTPEDRYGLKLSVSPCTKNVELGEDAVYILTVKNTGNVLDTFDLIKSGEGSLSDSSLTLSAGETGSTTLTTNGTSIKTYITTITATSQNDAVQTANVSTYTTVVRAVGVSVTPGSQTVYTGNASLFTLTIENIGTTAHTYNFGVEKTSDTADLNMESIYLVPGSSADVILTMNHSTSGMYTAKVTATVSGEPSKKESITVSTLFLTAPVYGVDLSVNTEEQAIGSGKYALYLLTIKNLGNQKDTFSLNITMNETEAVLSSSSVSLNASGTIGDTATATLNVTATAAEVYGVTVEACSTNDSCAKDNVETLTRVIGVSGNTVTDSEIDETSTVTNSIITRSKIVRSMVDPSNLTDSEITDSSIHDSSVADTVIVDVMLEDANVSSGTVYTGNITISGTTYNVTTSTQITEIVLGSDEADSSVAGADGGTTTVTSENTDSEVTIGNNESYVGGSLAVHKSTVPPEGTSSIELLGGYVSFEVSDNIKESLDWVFINLTYDPEDVPADMDEADLRLTYYNTTTSEWETLQSAGNPSWCYGAGVDTTAHIVWANVTHFSTYGIQTGGEVTLELRTVVNATDLTPGPDSVPPGEFIWVLFNNTNASATLFNINPSNPNVNVDATGHNYGTIAGNGTFNLTSDIEIASFSVTVTNTDNAAENVTLSELRFAILQAPVGVPVYNIYGLSAVIGLLAMILGISIRAKVKRR